MAESNRIDLYKRKSLQNWTFGIENNVKNHLFDFLINLTKQKIENVILDDRTSLETCFRFLTGSKEEFIIGVEGGEKTVYSKIENCLYEENYDYLYQLIVKKKKIDFSTDYICNFSGEMLYITIYIGDLEITFNPIRFKTLNATNFCEFVSIRKDEKINISSVAHIEEYSKLVEPCEKELSDISIEIKKGSEIEDDTFKYYDDNHRVIEIKYAEMIYFGVIKPNLFQFIKNQFDDIKNEPWKENYFKFKKDYILEFLFVR